MTEVIRTLFLLVLISAGYFATDVYLPSLPALVEYFQVDESIVQLTLFIYLVSFACSPIIFGPVSDLYGRKRMILFGFTVAIFSTVGCYFSTNILLFIVFRFVQGIGMGAVLNASRSMVTDLYKGMALARQLSYISMLMPVTMAMAPTLGGILQENFGWHGVFLFLIIYFLTITVCMANTNETLTKAQARSFSHIVLGYFDLLKNPPFIFYSMGLVLPTFALFSYLTASPFLFQEIIGLSAVEYGSLAIYIGAAIMISGFINAQLLKRVSVYKLLWTGSFLIITSGVLMLIFHSLGILNTLSVLLPALLFFCCFPLTMSNSASKAMMQIKQHFGSANGLVGTIQFLAGALGSLVFAIIPETDAFALGACFLIIGILSALNLFIAIRLEPKEHN